jgi:hypothetical protein
LVYISIDVGPGPLRKGVTVITRGLLRPIRPRPTTYIYQIVLRDLLSIINPKVSNMVPKQVTTRVSQIS